MDLVWPGRVRLLTRRWLVPTLHSLCPSPFLLVILSQDLLNRFLNATASHPHDTLGMHPIKAGRTKGVVVRAFVRGATACAVVDPETGESWPAEKLADAGFYEVFIAKRKTVFRYQLRVTRKNGELHQFFDPYAFLPTLGDQDLYLFNEGNEHRLYEKLGAHLRTIDGVRGVSFAVWAPNAQRVSVVGNFNGWDGHYHPMRMLGASGVWELFIPGLGTGELYKFEIWDVRGHIRIKTDPFGTYFEAPPGNAGTTQG